MATKSVIRNVNQHVGETVTIGAWINNKRSSGRSNSCASRWIRIYPGCCCEE